MTDKWTAIQLYFGAEPTGVPDDLTAEKLLEFIAGMNRSTGARGALTVRVLLELLQHEAIVREAYKDSVGVWTWGVGVTSRSGHRVERYKDDPQTIYRCLEIFLWLVQRTYLPAVLSAFTGHTLSEEQLAAALSFHWNTGAIGTASWVKSYKAGRIDDARRQFMDWNKPAEIIPRREKERDLFFDGKWSNDGKGNVRVWPVKKPSYSPDWGKPSSVNVIADLEKML